MLLIIPVYSKYTLTLSVGVYVSNCNITCITMYIITTIQLDLACRIILQNRLIESDIATTLQVSFHLYIVCKVYKLQTAGISNCWGVEERLSFEPYIPASCSAAFSINLHPSVNSKPMKTTHSIIISPLLCHLHDTKANHF